MSVQVFQVNAFADSPSSGNPAGVCLLSGAVLLACRDDAVRQRIAAEVGLSETAFIEPVAGATQGQQGEAAGDAFKAGSTFKLRWFTPTTEVPLCGHATLAAAAVLVSECGNPAPELHFETASGLLTVSRAAADEGGGGGGRLRLAMSLPLAEPSSRALPPSLAAEPLHGGPGSIGGARPTRGLTALLWPLLQSLQGVAAVPEEPHQQGPGQAPDWPSHWLSAAVHYCGFAAPLKYLLVVLQPSVCSGAALAALAPDIAAMADAISAAELTGVIVATTAGASASSSGADGYDLHVRFFGPWAGIAEDPVTGSAFTVAAPYVSGALLGGRQRLKARQCSGRGGDVWVDLGAQPGRVVVAGEAVMAATRTLPLV